MIVISMDFLSTAIKYTTVVAYFPKECPCSQPTFWGKLLLSFQIVLLGHSKSKLIFGKMLCCQKSQASSMAKIRNERKGLPPMKRFLLLPARLLAVTSPGPLSLSLSRSSWHLLNIPYWHSPSPLGFPCGHWKWKSALCE